MSARSRVTAGIVTILVFVGALAFMVTTGLQEGMARSVMAWEVASKSHEFESQLIEVNGFVVKGSMRQAAGTNLLRFQVWSPGGEGANLVNVEFGRALPDTVKDGGLVSVRGRLKMRGNDRYVFEANDVVGKCPTKYQPTTEQVVVPDFDPATAP